MAIVMLKRSHDDGGVRHPVGTHVVIPDGIMSAILKGELDTSSSFLSKIMKKEPKKRGPKPREKKVA